MKATTEIEIKVSGAKVINAELMPDGSCKLTVEMVNAGTKVNEEKVKMANTGTKVNEEEDHMFVLVEASKLSMKDDFMQYEPKTDKERKLKMLLEKAINGGVKDFKRPKCDPSFNKKKDGICYEFGKNPAVGKSYNWWARTAKEFKPGRSRLGTKTEYVAFLGVLIKKLVESGWSVKEAWDAVCNDSKELGHYWNSKNAKHDYESTGCREICGFYDLANCFKILATDEGASDIWLAGGSYGNFSCYYPLANLYLDRIQFDDDCYGVGWIVLD